MHTGIRLILAAVLVACETSATPPADPRGAADGAAPRSTDEPRDEPRREPTNSAVASTPTATEIRPVTATTSDAPVPPTAAPAPDAAAAALTIRSQPADPALAASHAKVAWKHYRADEFAAAAQAFALQAGVDPGYKPAHNLACAAARAGERAAALAALAESVRRGGETARALASKDKDLAGLRDDPRFAATVAATGAVAATGPAVAATGPAGATTGPAALTGECPPGRTRGEGRTCFRDIEGRFSFKPVPYSLPLALDVTVPARPSDSRWELVHPLLDVNAVATALGLKFGWFPHFAKKVPELLRRGAYTPFTWIERFATPMPFFWWPDDGPTPVLVLPLRLAVNEHADSLRRPDVYALALARHEADGWKAFVLPGWLPSHQHMGPATLVYSTLGMRIDELELFSLVQSDWDDFGDPEAAIPHDRLLCRVRTIDGVLNYACEIGWREQG